MRYTIAIVVALLATGGMFAFSQVMLHKQQQWASQGAALAVFQQHAITVAEWWSNYWYLGILAIVAACFAAAAGMPRHSGSSD